MAKFRKVLSYLLAFSIAASSLSGTLASAEEYDGSASGSGIVAEDTDDTAGEATDEATGEADEAPTDDTGGEAAGETNDAPADETDEAPAEEAEAEAGKSTDKGTPDANGFVISDNGVLTGYVGRGGDIVIPSDVVEIADGAFAFNNSIINVTIPGTVKKIGSKVFEGCEFIGKLLVYAGADYYAPDAFAGMPYHMGFWFVGSEDDWRSIENTAYIYDYFGIYVFICKPWESGVTIDANGNFGWNRINYPKDLETPGWGVYDYYSICVTNGSNMEPYSVEEQYIVDWTDPDTPRTGVETNGANIGLILARGCLRRVLETDQDPYAVTGWVGTAASPVTFNVYMASGSGYTGTEYASTDHTSFVCSGFEFTPNDYSVTDVTYNERFQGCYTVKLNTDAPQNATAIIYVRSADSQWQIQHCSVEKLVRDGYDFNVEPEEIRVAFWEGGIKSTEWTRPLPFSDISVRPDQSGFLMDGTTLVGYVGKGGEVVIPDNVEYIAENAFGDCGQITSIVIPGTVKRIEARAFANCWGIGRVIMYAGVGGLDERAFEDMPGHVDFYFIGNDQEFMNVGGSHTIFNYFFNVYHAATWQSNARIDDNGDLTWDNVQGLPVNLTDPGWAAYACYDVTVARGCNLEHSWRFSEYDIDWSQPGGKRLGVPDTVTANLDAVIARGALDRMRDTDNPNAVSDFVDPEHPTEYSVFISAGQPWEYKQYTALDPVKYVFDGFTISDKAPSITDIVCYLESEDSTRFNWEGADIPEGAYIYLDIDGNIIDNAIYSGDGKVQEISMGGTDYPYMASVAYYDPKTRVLSRWSEPVILPVIKGRPDWNNGRLWYDDQTGELFWDNYDFGEASKDDWRPYGYYQICITSDDHPRFAVPWFMTATYNDYIESGSINLLLELAKINLLWGDHDKFSGTLTVRIGASATEPFLDGTVTHFLPQALKIEYNGANLSRTASIPEIAFAQRMVNEDGSKSDRIAIKKQPGVIGFVYDYEEDYVNPDNGTPEGWTRGTTLDCWLSPETNSDRFRVCAVDKDGNYSEWSDWIKLDKSGFSSGRITPVDISVRSDELSTDEWGIPGSNTQGYASNWNLWFEQGRNYGFDPADIDSVEFTFEVADDGISRDIWGGDISGHVLLFDRMYDFRGVYDDELGIDTIDYNLFNITEKTGKYTYSILAFADDGTNPYKTGESEKDDFFGFNIGLCRYDNFPGDVTVTGLVLYNDKGEKIVAFDRNGVSDVELPGWDAAPTVDANGWLTWNELPENYASQYGSNPLDMYASYAVRFRDPANGVDHTCGLDQYYWTDEEGNINRLKTGTSIPLRLASDGLWKSSHSEFGSDQLVPGVYTITITGGEGIQDWSNDNTRWNYVGKGTATFAYRLQKSDALNSRPIIAFAMSQRYSYWDDAAGQTVQDDWIKIRFAPTETSPDIVGYLAVLDDNYDNIYEFLRDDQQIDVYSPETMPGNITVYAVDKYGNISMASHPMAFTDFPGFAEVPETERDADLYEANKDMWLRGLYLSAEDGVFEYGIDLSDIADVSVDFEVVSNTEFWDGQFDGAFVCNFGNKDCSDGHWEMKEFSGVDDRARGFTALHDDHFTGKCELLSADGLKFRYTFDVRDINPTLFFAANDISYFQFALQYYGDSASGIRINNVTAYDNNGNVLISFDGKGRTTAQKLTPPTVEAAGDNESVTLTWTPVTNAAFYEITGVDNDFTANVDASGETSYKVTGLENGKTYTYTVTAVIKDTDNRYTSAPVSAIPTEFKGALIMRGGEITGKFTDLSKAFAAITDAGEYEIVVNTDMTTKSLDIKSKSADTDLRIRTVDGAVITMTAFKISAPGDLTLDCDISSAKAIDINIAKNGTVSVYKAFRIGNVKGSAGSAFALHTDVTIVGADSVDKIIMSDEYGDYTLTVTGKLNKIAGIGGTVAFPAGVAANAVSGVFIASSTDLIIDVSDKTFPVPTITNIAEDAVLTLRYVDSSGETVSIPNGTIILKNGTSGKAKPDFTKRISIDSTDPYGNPLTAFEYSTGIKAEFGGAMTLYVTKPDGSSEFFEIPTLDNLADKFKAYGKELNEYYLTLNTDVEATKLTLPSAAAQFILDGCGKTLKLTAPSKLSASYNIGIMDITIDTISPKTGKLTAFSLTGNSIIALMNVNAPGLNNIKGGKNSNITIRGGTKLADGVALSGDKTSSLFFTDDITASNISTFDSVIADDGAVLTVTGKVSGVGFFSGDLVLPNASSSAIITTVGNGSIYLYRDPVKNNIAKVTLTSVDESLDFTICDKNGQIVAVPTNTAIFYASKAGLPILAANNIFINNLNDKGAELNLYLTKNVITAKTAGLIKCVNGEGHEKMYGSLEDAFNEMVAGGAYTITMQDDITVDKLTFPKANLSSLAIDGDGYTLRIKNLSSLKPGYDLILSDIHLETAAGKTYTISSAKGSAVRPAILRLQKFSSETLKGISALADSHVIISGATHIPATVTLSGAKTADLTVMTRLTADSIKTFRNVYAGRTLTVNGNVSAIGHFEGQLVLAYTNAKSLQKADIGTFGDSEVILVKNLAAKAPIPELTIAAADEDALMSICVVDTPDGEPVHLLSGTAILKLKDNKFFTNDEICSEHIYISNPMTNGNLMPYIYGKIIKAENQNCITVNCGEMYKDYPNLDKAFASMTDKNAEYTIYIHGDVTVENIKAMTSASVKKLTITAADDISTLIFKGITKIAVKYDIEFTDIRLACFDAKGNAKDLTISTDKNKDMVIRHVEMAAGRIGFTGGKTLSVRGLESITDITGFTTVNINSSTTITGSIDTTDLFLNEAQLTIGSNDRGIAKITVKGTFGGNGALEFTEKLVNGKLVRFAGIKLTTGSIAGNSRIDLYGDNLAGLPLITGFKKGAVTIADLEKVFGTGHELSFDKKGTTVLIGK